MKTIFSRQAQTICKDIWDKMVWLNSKCNNFHLNHLIPLYVMEKWRLAFPSSIIWNPLVLSKVDLFAW